MNPHSRPPAFSTGLFGVETADGYGNAAVNLTVAPGDWHLWDLRITLYLRDEDAAGVTRVEARLEGEDPQIGTAEAIDGEGRLWFQDTHGVDWGPFAPDLFEQEDPQQVGLAGLAVLVNMLHTPGWRLTLLDLADPSYQWVSGVAGELEAASPDLLDAVDARATST